jgi:hypothetical protein
MKRNNAIAALKKAVTDDRNTESKYKIPKNREVLQMHVHLMT